MPEVYYRRLSFKGRRNPDRFFFFFFFIAWSVWKSARISVSLDLNRKGRTDTWSWKRWSWARLWKKGHAEWFWFSLLGDGEILRKVWSDRMRLILGFNSLDCRGWRLVSAWRLLLPMGELMQDWTESPVAGWGGFKRELRVEWAWVCKCWQWREGRVLGWFLGFWRWACG